MTDPLELGRSLQSSAIDLLKKVADTIEQARVALADGADPKLVQPILREAEGALDNLKIEQTLAQASVKQLKAVGAMMARQHDNYVLLGGNQSGKSFCGALISSLLIRDWLPPNTVVWSVAPNAELSIKTPQRYLWELLPHAKFDTTYNPKSGFGSQHPMFTYDPGGRNILVKFKSQSQFEQDPSAFESETITGFVWIDEAIDEHCWNGIQPRIAIHNVPVIVSTIPRVEWMHSAFQEATPEQRVYFDKLLPMDNPVMTPEGYRRLEMSIASEDEKRMRLFGDFLALSGLVYKEFRKAKKPDGHLISPFPIPDDWPKWRTMDVGMNHPTVCLWCTVSPNGTKYVYREYRSRNTPIVVDAQRIIEMSRGESYQGGCIVDPNAYSITKANPKSVAQQFTEAGIKMTPGIRSSSVGEWALVQAVKRNLYENRVFVFDTCPGLISEFGKWKYKSDIFGEPKGDSFEDKNNDGLDALKYWVAIGPQYAPQQIEVESTVD